MTAARESSNLRLGIQSASETRTATKKKLKTSDKTAPARPNQKKEASKTMIAAQVSYAKSKLFTKNRLYSEAAAGPWAGTKDMHAKKQKSKDTMRKSRVHIPPRDSNDATYFTMTFNFNNSDYVTFFIDTLLEMMAMVSSKEEEATILTLMGRHYVYVGSTTGQSGSPSSPTL